MEVESWNCACPPSPRGRLSAIEYFAGTNCKGALSRGWSRATPTRGPGPFMRAPADRFPCASMTMASMHRGDLRPLDDKWLLVSDVDDTLLGDEPALAELKVALKRERPRIRLALNSSRPCASLRLSLERHASLPESDFLIGALGTEIQDAEGDMLEEYSHQFKSGWDRETVERLVPVEWARPHPPEWQTPFKASFDIDDPEVADWVRSRLPDERLSAKLIVTHGSKMDVIPSGAGKGAAIQFLRDRLMIDRDRVVVAGDSANDIDMFTDENHGIVVANADPELAALVRPRIYRAKRSHAAGVLEGLRYWGVL